MRRRLYTFLIAFSLLAALFAGCKSDPPPQPAKEAPAPQAATDLSPEKSSRLLFVNTKFEDEVSESYKGIRDRVQELAPDLKITIVHYREVTPGFVAEFAPDALLLGPQGTPWWKYDQEKLEATRAAVRGYDGPVLGICGGHQFLATTYGGTVAPMKCKEDHKGYDGCRKEEGFHSLRVRKADPLLAGLGGGFVVRENHYEEVKKMPEGFEVLASSDMCGVQAIRLSGRPVYGVQFHPERHDGEHPHGKQILQNFLTLAGLVEEAHE